MFGTLTRNAATLPDLPTLPKIVAERWRAAWGDEMVTAAAAAIATQPPLDLTLADPDGLAPEGIALAPGQRRLVDAAPVAQLPGYAEGNWWVQDIAASLPARLLGRGPGHALDLCAAPGGKTMQLAAAGWDVTALEISPTRAARLHENLARTHSPANVVIADALDWVPPAPLDALLIDAPCSATGIFRRHPDVLYRAHPAIIAEMAALQTRLLERAADWVRPGGRLVYATCSLEPAEGEEQLARFLSAHPDYRIDPPASGELPDGIMAHADGHLRTLPGTLADQGGCDGFFIVRLVRASA